MLSALSGEVPFKYCDVAAQEVVISAMHLTMISICIVPFLQCSFIFMSRPPDNVPRYCNAREHGISGFLYHCNSCGFDLHPCCAKLPTALDTGSGMLLYLYRKVSGPCQRCGKKGRSWSYRSSDKKYNLHVACAKDMVMESWHDVYYGGGLRRRAAIGEPEINSIPGLKGALIQTHGHSKYSSSKSKGKVQKCCEMAGMSLQFVISAVLGDPTSLIAGVIGSLMTR